MLLLLLIIIITTSNEHQSSILVSGVNVIQEVQTPGIQEIFLCLHCSLFVYASSSFFLSAANNATLLFLFEEPARAPAGHEGDRVEMEAVTVRDGNIEPGEPISTLHSWCSFSLSFL